MGTRRTIFVLIAIMTAVALVIGGVAIRVLYDTAFEQKRADLMQTAQSQARLMEAVARFDRAYGKDYPGGAFPATISQVVDAHGRYEGFGGTGEFTLARREGDEIVFLLRHRLDGLDRPRPVAFDSPLAEPMRRALTGKSGTVVGLDYRGVMVLAAHEPVAILDLGIVAKIDLAEVRAPFLRAGGIVFAIGFAIIAAGAALFFRISNPMVRRIQESEARLRTTVGNLVEGVVTIDERGVIESFNPAAERMFGCAAEEVIGRNVKVLMPEPDRGKHGGYITRYLETGEARIVGRTREGTGRRKDGTTFPLDLGVAEMGLGDQRVFVGTLRDITERKRAEEALRETNAALEHRTAELVRVNEELSQYTHVVSHDLKAPLRAIHNYSDWLAEDAGEALVGEPKEHLEGLSRSVRQAEALIDDLLELSRVGGKYAPSEAVELGPLFDRLVASLDLPQDVEVHVPDTLPTVTAAPTLLRQIFQNLILNGVKFNRAQRKRIEIACRPLGKDAYEVSVADNGIGIDGKYHDRIFRIFERLHVRDEYPGTGVGLAIVKKAVGRLGGAVRVESETGRGATFHVTVPAPPPADSAPGFGAAKPCAPAPVTSRPSTSNPGASNPGTPES